MVLQYDDSGRSFQEQEEVFLAMEFTVQVSTFCWTEVAVGRK